MAVFPTPTSARTSAIITVTIAVIITVKILLIITVIITAKIPKLPGQGNEISGCPGFPHPCYPDISGNSCRQSSRGRHPSGGEEEEEVSTLIGYARVSTAGECLDLQKDALDKADVYQLFVDVASGGKAKLPQLELALSLLGEGDTLVVWRLDRLGRSLGHLIRTVEELAVEGSAFAASMRTSTRPPAWANRCPTSSPPWPSSTATSSRRVPQLESGSQGLRPKARPQTQA